MNYIYIYYIYISINCVSYNEILIYIQYNIYIFTFILPDAKSRRLVGASQRSDGVSRSAMTASPPRKVAITAQIRNGVRRVATAALHAKASAAKRTRGCRAKCNRICALQARACVSDSLTLKATSPISDGITRESRHDRTARYGVRRVANAVLHATASAARRTRECSATCNRIRCCKGRHNGIASQGVRQRHAYPKGDKPKN